MNFNLFRSHPVSQCVPLPRSCLEILSDTKTILSLCLPRRKSLTSSELCPTPMPTSSSCVSAWSIPTRSTTSPRSGCRTSGPTTRPRPSSSLGLSWTGCWMSTSSSTWTSAKSSRYWAHGPGAWRTRSGPRTTSSARRWRRRTWRRRSMRLFLPPLRAKRARGRKGGFPTGAPKLSPGAAGRSSSASSELFSNSVFWRLYLFKSCASLSFYALDLWHRLSVKLACLFFDA